MATNEPKIIAFLCNWCAYAGADLAGVSRFQYPPNFRPIRVMCSGRVDPVFILNAFEQGADGVLVAGCHIGECHYIDGNVHAEKKIRLAAHLLELIGLGADRLKLAWVSAAEGQKFAEVTTAMLETVKTLNETDTPDPARYKLPLQAARRTLLDETVRWMTGIEREITESGDIYGRQWSPADYQQALDQVVTREYRKSLIYLALRGGCSSVRDVGAATGLALGDISYQLADMERTGLVEFQGMHGHQPEFAVVDNG